MFYKETQFQTTQTGKIPCDWQDATLSELSEHITKGTTPTTYGFSYESSGINFIKVESIDENGKFVSENIPHISKEANEALSRSMLKEKDILFSIAGALGRVALVSDSILPANTNQALSIIRIKEKEKVLPEYLKYFLTGPNIQEFIKSIAIQSQQANLNLEQVRKFRVGIPSFLEQKKIVEVLAVVDSALELADRLVANIERLKKGLMQQLLTRGIGHTEFKKSKVGEIPKEWAVFKLEEIAAVRYGLGQPPETDENGVPMIRATNIDGGAIIESDLVRVKRSAIPESRMALLHEGDLIVVRSGAYTGDIGYITKKWDGAIAGYDLVVSPSRGVNSMYLSYYLLSSKAQTYFAQLKSRSAQPHLNSWQVAGTPIIFPSLSEQENIATILSTIDTKVQLEKVEKAILSRIKGSLMDLLLTGKVRIRVD